MKKGPISIGILKAFIECKVKKNHGLKTWVWWGMKRHQAKVTKMIFMLHEYDTECCSTIQGSLPLSLLPCHPDKPHDTTLHGLGPSVHESLQPQWVWRCLQREEWAHLSLHSISVSQAWAGSGKGFGLLWQGRFGWVRWIQCGWWVDLATNMKTRQRQQVGRIYFYFSFMLVGGAVVNSKPSLPSLKEGCHLMITSSNFFLP